MIGDMRDDSEETVDNMMLLVVVYTSFTIIHKKLLF